MVKSITSIPTSLPASVTEALRKAGLFQVSERCETLENFMLDLWVCDAAPRNGIYSILSLPTVQCRLIPFVFSDEQAYILEWHYYIRFYMDGAKLFKEPSH